MSKEFVFLAKEDSPKRTSLGMTPDSSPDEEPPMMPRSNHWHLSVRRLG